MEAVNGLSEGDKGGPPPPSPLTGCYLLIVIGEPHSKEHKDIILQRVAKGLLSWDGSECLVDLEKELAIITEQAPEGEEARFGERLIQFASENLVTEVLIHPVVSTLAQCVRNLLSSFTRHRHIIHSGYTFAANGSWVLQDGTFSLADFSEAFQEIAVQRVIRAYENGISLDIHCSPEGDWTRLPKDPFTKSCKVRVNPNDVLTSGSPSIASFIDYISPFLIPTDIETLLESSDVVGNIRFSHPTLYVFPGGQGDAALFGINGFNMLLDGGFSRKACFWDFVRHLDRLDSVLLTRLNNSNINGISSVLRRKKQNAVYPQIGHFFCNIQERKALLSPDGDKDKDPLLINLLEEGQEIVTNLRHLNLCPQICYRDSEPINLYHKVGHGTLDMYVLSPAKESKEVREFLHKWNNNDPKLFAYQRSSKEFTFPLPNLVSICALLVWQPANPEDSITRILYPGSTPQQKIFEGLDKLKHLEFIKYPVCSEKMLTSTPSIVTLKKQAKDSVLEKLIEQKPQRIISEKLKQSPKLKTENKIIENNLKNGDASDLSDKQIIPDKTVKKSDSTDSEKSASKPPKPKKSESDIVNGKIDDKAPEKPKPKPKEEPKPKIDVKKTKRGDSLPRKPKPIEKKTSPTTPKKTLETKLNGELKEAPSKSRPPPKSSPSATPAKSTKDANNRKVVESKYAVQKKEPTKTADKKPERKPISRRPKDSPPAKMPGSPMKKVNGIQKPDTLSRKGKLDKEGTTDSSTVSTPSADQDSILKKDISKLTPEELEHLKAQELADLKEEQEVVKEIEAVFRKGEKETRKDENTDLRKVKDISIEDKVEAEEYLIIEKEVVTEDSLDEKDTKEDEIQKITRDSEESEKQREPPAVEKEKEVAKDKIEIEPPESDIAEEAEKREKVEEVKEKETTKTAEASKEISVTSPEEKLDVSSEKRTTDRDVDEENKEAVAAESQPEEKISGTAESGATTTAPTLPEDERIPLDEIKEDNGDQVIEEKHVKEETKEKEVPVIQLPPKTADVTALPPKVPPVVGIKLEKQTLMRDLVKTPDEVADLPVHEEVDADNYEDYQSNYKGTTPTDDQKASIKTAALEAKDTVQEAEKTVPQEKLSPEKIKSEEDNKRASVSPEEKIPHEEPMAKQIVDKAAVEEEPKKISSEKSHEDFKDVSPEKIKNEEERKDILHDADTDDKKLSEKQQAEITPTVKTDDKGKDEIRQMAETDDKKLSDEIRKKEEQDVFKSSENLEEKTAKEALFDDNKSHDNKEERAESPKTNEESKEKMLATEKEHESKAADIGDKTEIKAFKDTADEQAPCIKNVQDVLEKSQDVIVIKEVEKEPKESAEAIKTVDACELKNKEEKADVAEKDKIEKPAEEINDEPQQLKDAQKVLEKSQDVTVTKEIVEKESKEVAEAIKTAEKPSKIENKLEREEVKEESAAKPDNAVDTSAVCDKIDSSEVTIKENVDTQKISSVVEKTIIEGEKPTTVFTNKHLEERHLDVEEVTEEKEKIEPMEKEKVDLKTKEPVGEALDNHLLDEEQKVFDSVKIEEKMSATEKTEIDLQKTETLQDACKLNEKVQETTAEVASDLKLGTEKLEDSSKTQIDKNEIVKDLKTAEKEDNIVVSKTEEVKKVYSKEEHETDAKVFKPEKDSFDTEKSDAIKSEKEVAIETSDKKEAIAEKQKESVVEEIKTNKNETESKIEKPQSEEIKTEKSEDKIDSVEPEKAQSDDRSSESNKDVKNDEILVISHVEQPEHAESIVIPPSDSTPESPVSVDKLKQIDFTDKMELGRKSPKEREEDVAKIVASVAEVLKSDAPLEEFEGKLPFKTFPPFTPYTTELRETHITTVESPISEDGKIIKSVEMPTNIIETAIAEEPPCLKEETDMFLHEERKASPVFPEKGEKKITTLMRDSNELMEATSKIISEIKSGQSSTEHEVTEGAKEDKQKEEMKELEVESVKEGKPKEETKEPETDIAKEEKLKEETKEDTGVVHRMLVTASSEDGGEETVICPPGSIIFSRSSESSGRSSPDLQKTTSQRPSFDSSDVTQRKDGDKDSGKSSPDLKHHEADKEAQKGVESKDTVTPKIEENVEHKDKLSDVATEPTIQENKTDYKTGVAEDVSKPTEKSTGDKADTRKDSLVNGFNDAVVAKEPKSEPQEWQHLEKDVSKTDVPAKDICKEIKETKTDDIKKSVEHEEKTKVESVDTKISSIESAKGDVLSEPAKGKDGEQSTLSSVEDGGERELDKKSERDTDISKITLDDTKKEQKETKVTGLDSQCDFDHKHKQSDIAKDAVDKKLEESADNKHDKVQGEKDALKKDSGDTKIDKTQDEQPSKGSFAHSEKFDTKTEEAFASLQTDGSNDSDYYKDQEIEEFRRETGADSGIESFNDFGELDKEPIVLKDSEDVMLNGTFDSSPSSIETIKTSIVSEKGAKEIDSAVSAKEIKEQSLRDGQHSEIAVIDEKIDVPSNDCCATNSAKKTVSNIDRDPKDVIEKDSKDAMAECKTDKILIETAKDKDGEPQPKESVILEKRDSEIKDSVKIESIVETKEKEPCAVEDFSKIGEKQEHHSGKSTPELLNGKPELSGKSTLDGTKEKTASSVTSGKSTPDIKGEEIKCSTPDSKQISGKSSPVALSDKNVSVSGKTTPEVVSQTEILKCSTPDSNLLSDKNVSEIDNVHTSGKTTPELLKDDRSITSGKSTPEIKLESVKDHSESIANADGASLTSGISTPEIRESSKSITETEFDVLEDRDTKSDVCTVKDANIAGPSNILDKELTTSRHLSPSKTSTEELHLSGKSTPDIADVEKKESQDILGHEKHISGSSTPPTVPVSPIIKDKTETINKKSAENVTITSTKEAEQRSFTPASDEYDLGGISSAQSDVGSSGRASRAPQLLESDKNDSEEEDMPGSPLSMTSQVAHSRSSSHYDFEEDKFVKGDQMTMSFYGSLPDDPLDDKKAAADVDFEQAIREHQEARGEVLGKDAPTYLYEVTKAKYSTTDVLSEPRVSSSVQDPMTCSFIGELPTTEQAAGDDKKDPIASWGKPLGLPSPAPPTDNKGTPKKERKLPPNVSAKNKLNDDKKRSESPSKFDKKQKKMPPVYVDLTYVPHHGNSNYSYVDFFKRVRARYYVFSGIEPSKEVYNALLEAKQTWDDKDLEVTIIPTYDTDILGYWVAENEDLLAKYKIDLSPSASRCTINLQDHETSCSAYRLEF